MVVGIAVPETKNPAPFWGAGSGSCYWVCVVYTYPNPAPVRTVIRRVTRMRRPVVSAALPRATGEAGAGGGAVMIPAGCMLRCVMDRPKHTADSDVNCFRRAISLTPDTDGKPRLRGLCPDSFGSPDCANSRRNPRRSRSSMPPCAQKRGNARRLQCVVVRDAHDPGYARHANRGAPRTLPFAG